MATDFTNAVEYVLAREGGLKEAEPSDPGGITNHGVSKRFILSLSDEKLRKYGIFQPISDQTIRDLTIDQVKSIYRGEFWEAAPFGQIKDELLGCYIFDMAVNCGLAQAIKIVQRSIWAASYSRKLLKDDGILGRLTLERLNLIVPDMILPVVVALRAAYYQLLVKLDPGKERELNGWLNRCYGIFT